MAPLIGITPTPTVDSLAHGTFRRYVLAEPYLQAVTQAGGTPVIIPPLLDRVDDYLRTVDGLVLSGGGDIEPERYGAFDVHPATYGLHADRDAFEIALVQAALRLALPVFAICRGIQVLNVSLGGTLIQDVASLPGPPVVIAHRQHEAGLAPDDVGHPVALTASWPLPPHLQAPDRSLGVNSFHHQALDQLGDRLEPVAFALDGLVEAVIVPDHPFALGVQWHPELMFHRYPVHHQPFRALVAAAEARTLTAVP